MSGAFTNVEWRGKYKHVYGMEGVGQITLRLHLNKMIRRWNFKSIVTDKSNLLCLKDLWTGLKFLPLHSSFFVFFFRLIVVDFK